MSNVEDLVQEGQKLENGGRIADALSKFAAAVEQDPTRMDAQSGLVRCTKKTPDAVFEAQIAKQPAVGATAGMVRAADVTLGESHMNEQFELKSKAEESALTDHLAKVGRLQKDAGINAKIDLSNDEVKLIAGLRVLKAFGFATATMQVAHRRFSGLKVDSVRTDFSS